MSEVLTALGRSSSDPDAVLDTVVESARRLCRCAAAAIYLIEDDHFVLSSSVGLSGEFVSYIDAHPMKLDRRTLVGRVTQDRTMNQVPDVLRDPEYGRQDLQEIGRYRTLVSAPMLLDDEVVGALSLFRTEVDPFDDRAFALLGAFAALLEGAHQVHVPHDHGGLSGERLEQRDLAIVERIDRAAHK